MIIGRNDGQIYLGRSLNGSWNVYPDRVNVDLNRTILYVEQQFGATVNSVWLFGKGAEGQARVMQAAVKLPVHLSPVQPNPFYWNAEALKLSNTDTNNLVSAEMLQAPHRRLMLRVTGLIIGAAALGIVIGLLVLWHGIRRIRRNLEPGQDQAEFAETLQIAGDEDEAHRLLQRHLERTLTATSAMLRAPLRPSPALTSATIPVPISPSTAVKGARPASANS